ncbi:MAG: S41 family peptidase [Candidatus Azobacteroides sp.]|nr:S41 family peptidase [Candidatus Azobacteroides sp.]
MNKFHRTFLILLLGFVTSHVNAQQTENEHFEASKQLDVFNALFKELDIFYVDTIDAETSIRQGIDYMLSKLDPYTVYYSEDEMNDFKFMTTGEYAGIGAVISQRDGKIIISDPYEGEPAVLAGLQAGDEILEIDGESVAGKTSTQVSDKLKGQPNTIVKIKFQSPGEKKSQTVDITRKRIQLDPVKYYGIVKDSIGYIYLSGFTDQSAAGVRSAFEDLKNSKHITSLILDLRDNPGGLMNDAIQLVNMFVPKGELVLSTKGKVKQWDRMYRTTQEPVDSIMPLVVLVNRGSASASEIVAGALQDLDRAVIIGTRTFGKGLVQTSRDLPYNGSLKVTTSKYYIPSGRCIQAIDYSHRNPDGSVATVPDSLTSIFHTSSGREVKDGGGITPDFTIEEVKTPNIIYYLLSDYIIFDFATEYKHNHKKIAPVEDFSLTDEDYQQFKTFVKSKNFDYDRQSGKALSALKETMEFEGYDVTSAEFTALEEKLKPDLDRDLELYKDDISKFLTEEILKRYYFQKGEILETLKNDTTLEKAIEVLSDKTLYNETLTIEN